MKHFDKIIMGICIILTILVLVSNYEKTDRYLLKSCVKEICVENKNHIIHCFVFKRNYYIELKVQRDILDDSVKKIFVKQLRDCSKISSRYLLYEIKYGDN